MNNGFLESLDLKDSIDEIVGLIDLPITCRFRNVRIAIS